ncbi:MAG: metal-sulfur cluster assembly factor [Anaerolineales bacterium]
MIDPEQLKKDIIEKLSQVIDPETGADVIRMRLVDDLQVSQDGNVSYTFRPSSPLCPIAVYLAMQVKQAVAAIPGVLKQKIEIKDYIQAEELTELINLGG